MFWLTPLAPLAVVPISGVATQGPTDVGADPSPPKLSTPRVASTGDGLHTEVLPDPRHVLGPKRWQLSALIGPRITSAAPYDQTYTHVLAAYGYGSLTPQFEISLNGAVSVARFLDVGAHVSYLLGSGGSSGTLFLHEFEAGGFAAAMFWRNNPTWSGGVGIGAEAGIEAPLLVLHGAATGTQVPYAGPIVIARIGTEPGFLPVIHLRYLVSDWPSAIGKYGFPLGGLSITLGGNLAL